MPRLRLRTKLLLSTLVPLLPLLAIFLVGSEATYAMRRSLLLQDLVQTAQAVAVATDGAFLETEAVAEVLAADPAIEAFDPTAAGQRLAVAASHYPAAENIGLIDRAGNLVASARPAADASPINVADRGYFQQVMATGLPAVSPVVLGRMAQEPLVGVAVPVFDHNGAALGLVVVGLRLGRTNGTLAAGTRAPGGVEQRLGAVGLWPGQSLFLIDPTGQLAFHSGQPDPSWYGRDLTQVLEIGAMLRQSSSNAPVVSTEFQSPIFEDRRAVALIRTPRYGWLVGVSWSLEEAFGPLDRMHAAVLIAFALVVALTLLTTLRLAHFFTGPLRTLVAHARRLGTGDLDQHVAVGTGDEIEEVGAALNAMADDLAIERQRREQFVAAVAHELAGPATVMLSWCGMLERSSDPARRAHAAQQIEQAVRRQTRLIGDLRDASTLAMGKFMVNPEPMDLAALAQEIIGAQQPTAPAHRLLWTGPPSLPGAWDRERLAQVVQNLVSNAVKYSPGGGGVRIAAEVTEHAHPEVHVSVTDSGLGMRPEEIERLFQPFERLESAGRIAGTGLGLYICRGIVEAHGGRLWAESPGPGRGSSFHLTLPLEHSPSPA